MTNSYRIRYVMPSNVVFHPGDKSITFKADGTIDMDPAWRDQPDEAARAFIEALTNLYPSVLEDAVRDMRERAAKEADDFWDLNSATDRIRALPLRSK